MSPYFLQGVDVYMLCVRLYAHTHTLHVRYLDVSPDVGTRYLESPAEIQMYCSNSIHMYRDSIHMYRTEYEVQMQMSMLCYK